MDPRGLCHSNEHLVTGDMVPPDEMLELMGSTGILPIIGGHEGSGIVAEVGTYPLADINVGYEAMRNGENIRGVIVHG